MEKSTDKNHDPIIQAEINPGNNGGNLETPEQLGDQDKGSGEMRKLSIRPTIQRSDILEAQEDWLR